MATAAEKLASWKARAQNLKKENEARIAQGVALLEVGVGGAAAGYIRGRYPDYREIGGVDSEFVIGGVLVVLGFTDLAGDLSDDLMALGAGMVAYGAGRRGEEAGLRQGT